MYPDAAKFKKQFKYANDRGVRWVMVLGEDERASGVVSLKDMVEPPRSASVGGGHCQNSGFLRGILFETIALGLS